MREIAGQVGARLRAHHVAARVVSLHIGFVWSARTAGQRGSFGNSMKIETTNDNYFLTTTVLKLFTDRWQGEAVRNIAISCSDLVDDRVVQLNIFDVNNKLLKQRQLDRTVDAIRQRYGFRSIVKLSSLMTGATAIQRTGLVGGHNGGNAYD